MLVSQTACGRLLARLVRCYQRDNLLRNVKIISEIRNTCFYTKFLGHTTPPSSNLISRAENVTDKIANYRTLSLSFVCFPFRHQQVHEWIRREKSALVNCLYRYQGNALIRNTAQLNCEIFQLVKVNEKWTKGDNWVEIPIRKEEKWQIRFENEVEVATSAVTN